MNKQGREFKYFLFSEYFAYGVRTTVSILFPALLFAQLNHLEVGIPISIGAFCVSLTDVPGPVTHKRNGILICTLVIFLVAMLTGFAQLNTFLMGVEILLFSFFFSMLTVYGNRASLLGTAALLVMLLMMDQRLDSGRLLEYSVLIAGGGIWYLLLSMLFSHILPYRPAQQALGECIREVAKFLRFKADFYSPSTDLDEDYRKLVSQQVVVSEKQDDVRELLLKSRVLVKDTTNQGSILVLTFADVVDLYEQMMAIHYDYAAMREKYSKTGILLHVARLIRLFADELDDIGWSIQTNSRHTSKVDLHAELDLLREKIEQLQESNKEVKALAFKKILVNLRNMILRLDGMRRNFTDSSISKTSIKNLEYTRFVTHQDFSFKKFRDNLTPDSSIFKHSVRVASVCLFGYIFTKYVALGHHSYWVILTIIVILKPAFSLTKQRNYQRLIGTIIGGAIGILILAFVQDTMLLLLLLVISMVGTFSFMRTNYVVCVTFMTPFILIIFSFLGKGGLDLAQERIVDTLIGCAIAFTASYLIFPNWESAKLNLYMQEMIQANIHYLQKLADRLEGIDVSITDYKLARKEVYISSANLSAAFQRMISEPKSKQKDSAKVHSFLVLNHILSARIATVASSILAKEHQSYPHDFISPIVHAIDCLHTSSKKLVPTHTKPDLENFAAASENGQGKADFDEDAALLKEQLEFILKVSQDISKVTDSILAHE